MWIAEPSDIEYRQQGKRKKWRRERTRIKKEKDTSTASQQPAATHSERTFGRAHPCRAGRPTRRLLALERAQQLEQRRAQDEENHHAKDNRPNGEALFLNRTLLTQ